MISGFVTSDHAPIVRLTVLGPKGHRRKVEALIDTGFDGRLSLPTDMIAELRLPWRRRGLALLADGGQTEFDVHDATVFWDRRKKRVPVDASNTFPLIGMSLLKEHELKIQVRKNGKVTIRPLRGK